MANLAQLVPVVAQPDRNINAVLTPKPGYRVCIQILNHEYAVYYKHTDRRTEENMLIAIRRSPTGSGLVA